MVDPDATSTSDDRKPEAETAKPGLVRRSYRAVKFPPATTAKLFTQRNDGVMYLGAWSLTGIHIFVWILIAVGVVKGLGFTIADSILSFVATCLLIWMVIIIHRRLQIRRGRSTRGHVLSAWWRGPWDPVGRQIWLPVRFGAAWDAVWHSDRLFDSTASTDPVT